MTPWATMVRCFRDYASWKGGAGGQSGERPVWSRTQSWWLAREDVHTACADKEVGTSEREDGVQVTARPSPRHCPWGDAKHFPVEVLVRVSRSRCRWDRLLFFCTINFSVLPYNGVRAVCWSWRCVLNFLASLVTSCGYTSKGWPDR